MKNFIHRKNNLKFPIKSNFSVEKKHIPNSFKFVYKPKIQKVANSKESFSILVRVVLSDFYLKKTLP